MATQNLFTYSEADLIKLCNEIREVVVNDMCVHHYIVQAQQDQYLRSRVLMGYKPSWFGKVWSLLNKKSIATDNGFTIIPITLRMENELSHPEDNKGKVIKLVKDNDDKQV
jgi:hypothetical protein